MSVFEQADQYPRQYVFAGGLYTPRREIREPQQPKIPENLPEDQKHALREALGGGVLQFYNVELRNGMWILFNDESLISRGELGIFDFRPEFSSDEGHQKYAIKTNGSVHRLDPNFSLTWNLEKKTFCEPTSDLSPRDIHLRMGGRVTLEEEGDESEIPVLRFEETIIPGSFAQALAEYLNPPKRFLPNVY